MDDYDANNNSQFMFKPADSVSTLLYAGPAWDYDTSFGAYSSKNKRASINPSLFWVNRDNDAGWYHALYSHEEFREAVCRVWKERFKPAMDILNGKAVDETGTLLSIDEYAAMVSASGKMDYIRWPDLKKFTAAAGAAGDYPGNVKRLKNFASKRAAWLDKQWGR